jgi:hypothetical protein
MKGNSTRICRDILDDTWVVWKAYIEIILSAVDGTEHAVDNLQLFENKDKGGVKDFPWSRPVPGRELKGSFSSREQIESE